MNKLKISQIQFEAKSTPDENAKLLKTNFLKVSSNRIFRDFDKKSDFNY